MTAQKSSAASDRIKGSVKEAIGKLIGDERVEAEGKSEQAIAPKPQDKGSQAGVKPSPAFPTRKAGTNP